MRKILLFGILYFFTEVVLGQQQDSIPKNNFIDRATGLFVSTMDKLTFETDRISFSVYPIMGLEPQTGLQLGLMPVVRFLPKDTTNVPEFYYPTTLMPSFMVSTKGKFSFELEYLMHTRSRWVIMLNMKINDLTNDFYGVSNNHSDIEPFSYDFRDRLFNGEVLKGVSKNWFIGVRVEASDVKNKPHDDIYNGSIVFDSSLLGYDGGFTLGFGPAVKYDSRDDIFFPTKGILASSYYLDFPKSSFNDYHFQRWMVDLRYYHSIFDERKVMAMQFVLNSNHGDVPFYLMSQLGGMNSLRGIVHPFRYIDDKIWFSRAEYRQMFKNRFGYALYMGIGNQFDNVHIKPFDDVKFVYGTGLRFLILPEDRMNFRADLGFGPHGQTSLYFTLLEAF